MFHRCDSPLNPHAPNCLGDDRRESPWFQRFRKPCFANDIEPFSKKIYDEPGVKNCKLSDPPLRRVFAI
jgi:hypothetical protein